MSQRSSVRIGGTIGSGGRAARLLGSEVRVLLPEVRCEVAYDLSTHAASAKLNLYKRQVRQHYRGAFNRGGKPGGEVAGGNECTGQGRCIVQGAALVLLNIQQNICACSKQVSTFPSPSSHAAITARAALDLASSVRNLRDHARLFDNTWAALRGKLAIVGNIVDRGERGALVQVGGGLPKVWHKIPHLHANSSCHRCSLLSSPPCLLPPSCSPIADAPRIMLRGGVSATAGLLDIKTPDWSAVPAARTKDMQASGAQCGWAGFIHSWHAGQGSSVRAPTCMPARSAVVQQA